MIEIDDPMVGRSRKSLVGKDDHKIIQLREIEMKKMILQLGCIGGMFLALVAFSGCGSGGSSGSSGSSPASSSSPTTSSVGGSVSGLIGSGLVLQNNGSDDLTVNADNKTFKFPTRLKEGMTYNVTILSQPTAPAQTCEVISGSEIVSASSVSEVKVRCLTQINETFGGGDLNSGYWNSSGAFDRKIVDGKLQFKLEAAGKFAYNYLPFMDKSCGKVSADVTITDTVFIGTGTKTFGSRLQSCSYHTSTDGEAPDRRTGDVDAEIIWNGMGAYFRVFRCLNAYCSNPDDVEYLTPNATAGVPLGTTQAGSTATLSIDWDSTLAPGLFTFQLNNDPPVYFDPVKAGASIDADAPNMPEKYIGVYISLENPDDKAEMTATVDNVIDGFLNDNFDSGIYLNGSFWEKTNGRLQIENGSLVLETGQEFVGDPVADNRFNDTTSLISHDDMIPTGEVVEADITLDPSTFIIDFGGNPAEVYALLEMEFRPHDADKEDFTNLFVVRAALRDGPLGGTAEIIAEGCVNFTCSAKYTIANGNLGFNTPVVKGKPYHLKIEYKGNGAFDVTLNSNEKLTVNLSYIPGFALTEFSEVGLKTASRRTDKSGEEAFIRAIFDNVRVGRP